jgi:hypothetical protein
MGIGTWPTPATGTSTSRNCRLGRRRNDAIALNAERMAGARRGAGLGATESEVNLVHHRRSWCRDDHVALSYDNRRGDR